MGARNRSLLVDVVAHLKVKVDASLASCVRPYCSALKALASLDREAAKGAEIRSCIKWVEEGETSSSYFIQLEKEHAVDRWIPVLRESGGSIVSAPEGLCCTLNSFYSDLFSSVLTDSVIQSSLLSYLPYFLPCDQAHLCEDLLTPDECFSTLKGIARNKTPGLNGFPVEFYLWFWDVLGADLVSVLNSCFLSGSLALSQRRGIITLSFKKGDHLDPQNWRPITLLNVDYKITSRMIAAFFEKSSIFWLTKIRLAGFWADLLGKIWPCYVMWYTMPPRPVPLWQFCPLIRRSHLTESIGAL